MRFVMILTLALPFISDVTPPVPWGAVSLSEWQELQQTGWQGNPTDGREALYPPGSF